MKYAAAAAVLVAAVLVVVNGQSGDGFEYPLNDIETVVVAVAGGIVLLLCVIWGVVCYKLCCIEKDTNNKLKVIDNQHEQRLAQVRRHRDRQMEMRNVRRAMVNSLADDNGDNTLNRSTDTIFRVDHSNNSDDWFFDTNYPRTQEQQSPPLDSHQDNDRPPSFNSIMPFDHQSPQYVSSSYPPFTQQQRMLNTFQNIPQIIVSNNEEEEEQPIVRGTEGEEERIENMGDRYQHDNDIEMEREWERGRTGMEYGGIEYRSTGMGDDEQNDGRPEEYPMSSSEDDDSNGDSYSDSSSSSINIDELISRHLTNVPKIGMVTMGTASSKKSMVAMDTPPLQNRFGSNQYFQRFDHRSRVPVYPSANRNNPYRMGGTTNIPYGQHPLSQSYNSNR